MCIHEWHILTNDTKIRSRRKKSPLYFRRDVIFLRWAVDGFFSLFRFSSVSKFSIQRLGHHFACGICITESASYELLQFRSRCHIYTHLHSQQAISSRVAYNLLFWYDFFVVFLPLCSSCTVPETIYESIWSVALSIEHSAVSIWKWIHILYIVHSKRLIFCR